MTTLRAITITLTIAGVTSCAPQTPLLLPWEDRPAAWDHIESVDPSEEPAARRESSRDPARERRIHRDRWYERERQMLRWKRYLRRIEEQGYRDPYWPIDTGAYDDR